MISIPQALQSARRLYQAGDRQRAEDVCLQVLETDGNQIEALHLLGVIARQTGRLDRAAECLHAVLRLRPDLAEAHSNLGNVYAEQRRFADAVACYQAAVRLKLDYAEARSNLGNALRGLGRFEEAETVCREAIKLRPESAEAHINLGNALQDQARLQEAVDCYREALRLRPASIEACNNLGNVLREQGKLSEAERSLQQALRVEPNNVAAHFNLGIVQWELGWLDEAEDSNRHVLRLKPDHAKAMLNLGTVLKDLGRLDEAIAAFRAAMELKPDDAQFQSNLIGVLHYHPDYDPARILEECRRWNVRHGVPLEQDALPHSNSPDPERRLRVGYVSPDFRDHVDSLFTIPLLSHHDHRQFEIVCYADVSRPDALTERLRGYADVWHNIARRTDQEIAELARADAIDILVDLKLHTAGNRLGVFARKPAPVQATWLGYPGTTGLTAIDYRLTDPYLDPPGSDAFYTEVSIRLPNTFWCYDPLVEMIPVNALPALQNGFVTFGCLNNFCKVNEGTLNLWAKVLHAVPSSRLVLLAPRGRTREHVTAEFLQKGILPQRIEFIDRQPRRQYLQIYHQIDLGLDPIPCPGHTTSLDALWMGVPTITTIGNTAVGRAGWSQLCNLGLRELAGGTREQLPEIAVHLTRDLRQLQELRSNLRQRMEHSALMNANHFARSMEDAYREMWRRRCRNRG
jgi:predicted O-linked N-acetylglucosamine transferase (SPINDLY family)